ncbi:protein-L-isoaspartate(D-aspartate) O-methyltransferase [Belliella kenyensis]|uniref:Protein-L-isoaspartate O-methyltransferase n=1 Tax=Belliella kenyensis TaxID=1472724 RepID=A0ABV8EJQ3_9BACT|nr:protein-L-isoaspartate(D-aspartate) O-methyltransferase [Belliella kenyensis]MCH7403237.1 protein-L-isoaspartate(D-aspartate) O-methyltransferase [Belliella kenyensis]MDN3604848.1 protein-L-isoaspartate(D-aspartate) O-methyltransferase [Belliella kenyensis]
MLKLEDTYRHKGQRNALVNLLRQKGIKNEAVLDAINTLPRHFFFDTALDSHAYEDKAFPIGEGQTISQPFTVAFQSELLDVRHGDKILEIGTGSGYQATILHLLGGTVHSIEYQIKLYEKTKKFLTKLAIPIHFYHGDGSQGLPSQAPYDKIIVTAGAPVVPNALLHQLKIGGILVIPVGDRKSQKMMKLTKKTEKQIIQESFDNFAFVPLLGADGWKTNR